MKKRDVYVYVYIFKSLVVKKQIIMFSLYMYMPWGKNGCQKKFKELTNLSPLVSKCFLFHLLLINDYNPMLTNTCGLLYLFLFIHPWCSSILYLLAFNVWLPLFLKKTN